MTAEEPELLNCNGLAENQECKLAQWLMQIWTW